MVKSVFVSPLRLDGIQDSGANHLIVVSEGLDTNIWNKLKTLNIDLSISLNAFGPYGCPANPQSKNKLFNKLNSVLQFQPDEIWIDYFRFDGHWEAIEGAQIPNMHPPCNWCNGKTRVDVIEAAANEVMDLINKRSKIGYFAVPFKSEEVPELISGLGQDHSVLGKIFDLSSPMLYHQMIKRPPSYVSEYVKWLSAKTQKSVLPIIQIKCLPDNLEDTLNEEEITSVFSEAVKEPSLGVSFFWWTHALEKSKTGIIKRLFTAV